MIKNKFYFKRYMKFIDSCSKTKHFGYTEKHHIIPKSLGGTDDPNNIIILSGRQHFLAHWMLWKAYQNDKTTFAFWAMKMNSKREFRLSSKTYELLKEQHSKFQSIRMSLDNPMHNPEAKEKLRNSKLGTIASDKTKLKMSNIRRGVKKSSDTRTKMSLSAKGVPKSKQHCEAMSLNHCDISGKNNPMYGRSITKEKNLKWYTNGNDNKFISEGTQPVDWIRGRTIKKSS